jgi:glycosylphosphatidylinositol transamidase (GPIT) subunit GPI8
VSQETKLTSRAELTRCCKDIENWPSSWEIGGSDLVIGTAILDEFKSFLINRIEKGRAKSTIKIYGNYLWVLGGELIRSINEDTALRRLSARKIILKHVDDSGGPLWRHARDEMDHQRYDSVSKQLFRFLTAKPTENTH